jgi:hypothetical protein
MVRAFALMPVQAVTPIMSLAMMLLELVVALVVLDHGQGRDIIHSALPISTNPIRCMNRTLD